MLSISMSDFCKWVKRTIVWGGRPNTRPPSPPLPDTDHLRRDLNLIEDRKDADWRDLLR